MKQAKACSGNARRHVLYCAASWLRNTDVARACLQPASSSCNSHGPKAPRQRSMSSAPTADGPLPSASGTNGARAKNAMRQDCFLGFCRTVNVVTGLRCACAQTRVAASTHRSGRGPGATGPGWWLVGVSCMGRAHRTSSSHAGRHMHLQQVAVTAVHVAMHARTTPPLTLHPDSTALMGQDTTYGSAPEQLFCKHLDRMAAC